MSAIHHRTLFVLLLACGTLLAQKTAEPPDTILVNGRVFTATEVHPYVEAIAIRGARIQAVSTNREITALAGPNTRRIDLEGHLVIPRA